MTENAEQPLSGLARALIQHGRITEANAIECTKSANPEEGFIIEVSKRGFISSQDLALFGAQIFGFPALDISTFDPTFVPADAIEPILMTKHQVVALLKRNGRLTVALADPTNLRAIDEIRFQTGLAVDPVVVEAAKLKQFITKVTDTSSTVLNNLSQSAEDLDSTDVESGGSSTEEVEDAPIVRFIKKILVDAINEGASDIHFEPYEKFYRVRVRTDGILREIAKPPVALREKIAARIKVISRLDISEKRVPQDGRMKLILSPTKAIDFRVSTLPTMHGEKIVMRILDPSSAMMGIEALGYEPEQKAALLDAVTRPYGMVLVTGPTGSGKTVSLYTCLNILNQDGVNISTAEDPAEINLPGINQVTMNDKAGLNFAAALKSFLRQDPDIIMVGEIRDLETAEISIKAAQTGHLVLSTLHTNDAPTTLERLRNMGVAPFNIASSVIMITAQRLARRLCTCKKPLDLPPEALFDAGYTEADLDGTWTPYGPGGCERCKGSGYKGRVGIYQVMPISDEIRHIIMTGGNSMDIAAQAQRENINDLRQSGLLKVRQGMTSIEEVLACTNE